MKKLLGYRLKEEKYREAAEKIKGREIKTKVSGYDFRCDTFTHNKLSEAGVMHWFEEVYEEYEKFKVGDIVAWEGINFKVGKIQRKCDRFSDSWYLDERHNSCSEINLRHATEEEKKCFNSLNGKTAIIDGVEYELKIK